MATIQEILEYATTTPENSNPNVLNDMLSSLEGGQSIGTDAVVPFIIRITQEGVTE